ncbi:hypothetical protein AB1Y20_022611 [Prymnesium parvum]|uniref:50S ribosomal protein L25 n=1 Tax=Prymnesium parvum TaxID=97485 RepID=A0AB34JK13_PRYPA
MWRGAPLRWPFPPLAALQLPPRRGYKCQNIAEQISITARPRPPTPRKMAQQEFWRSGRLPANVHGDKLGPLWITVPFDAYMKLARKPHIQRKLLRLDMETEDGVRTGESIQVLTEEVFEKLPFHPRWNEDYDYVTFRRWPRKPPLLLKIPFDIINVEKCAHLKSGNYAHDMFAQGLPCLVSDVNHIPYFLEADMSKAVDGDFRVSDVVFPPGVEPKPDPRAILNQGPNLPGKSYPNFLIVRAKRIKQSK